MEYTRKQRQALLTMVAFRRAERAIARDEGKVCREYGVTPIQFGVLETLYSSGDLHVGDLLDKLLATPGNMTVVLRNMERDGYILRTRDETDRRSYVLTLTDKGRTLIEEMLPKHVAVVEEIFGVLTLEEQKALVKLLRPFRGHNKEENSI